MNSKNIIECPVCKSTSLSKFNSYKHKCYACFDCNSVHHIKKTGRYLFEWFLPVKILARILPRPAYMRLFHAPTEGFPPSEFYDGYANKALYEDAMKLSQVEQLFDQFSINNLDISDREILDISGGPGVLASALKDKCRRMVVTEYSQTSVDSMREHLGVDAVKFDYLNDQLEAVVEGKFDIILIRSSIIFCHDIEKLLKSISKILRQDGYILLETIIPTLGEVFWWQQMEYKFPIIYSQMALESFMFRHGYKLRYGYREYGSYVSIKWRGEKKKGFARMLFTWMIDYPMVLFYYFLARKSKIPIDQSLRHKFLTQLWHKSSSSGSSEQPVMRHYDIGEDNRSPHFSYIYNGYLKSRNPITNKE